MPIKRYYYFPLNKFWNASIVLSSLYTDYSYTYFDGIGISNYISILSVKIVAEIYGVILN